MESLDISNIPLMCTGAKGSLAKGMVANTSLSGLCSRGDPRSTAHLAKLSLKRATLVVMNRF
jgi:hypothetical protein